MSLIPHSSLSAALTLLSAVALAQSPAPADEAAIREVNRATDVLFQALGHNNAARVDSLLAPAFVYQPLGFMDQPRTIFLDAIRGRAKNPNQLRRLKLEWNYRDVLLQGTTAVFNGEAVVDIERQGRRVTNTPIYNLVWVRTGPRWQLLHGLEAAGGAQLTAQTWNKVFHDSVGFDLQPNRFLEQAIQGVKPGTALDVAMGQGRNTLLLARKGWRTTGIDVATEGLRIAQQQAAREKLTIETQAADVGKYDFGQNRWDLIALIYYGPLDAYLDRFYAGLRPGGLLVFEGFPGQAVSRHPGAASQPPPVDDLRQKLEKAGFQTQTLTSTTDQADYGLRPSPLVRVLARKKDR
ncbi:MAG TPA: methyltransferase domain-containing protein [Prosthecobacter sp.]|nr:methyltransferase domain-containing protein [Prosthecobacter sp.]